MSTRTTRESQTQSRKAEHLSICTNQLEFQIEHSDARFSGIKFTHNALPEISLDEVDLRVTFLGAEVAMPLFISCMTGGSEEGYKVNHDLARAAQECRIPVGTGSVRVLLDHPEVLEHFRVKPMAPDVPLMANIGGVELTRRNHAQLLEVLRRLEADAIVIHLNPGQELYQEGGDRDFRNVLVTIARFRELSPLPMIVKETGFGIAPSLIGELLRVGVDFVDVAGAGGTNWIRVESFRDGADDLGTASEFNTWGIPTAYILAAAKFYYEEQTRGRLLSSGGVRTGIDIAASIAMGAELAGMALPFARAQARYGKEGVVRLVERVRESLRNVMLLTGSRTMSDLRNAAVWYEPSFTQAVDSFVKADRRAGATSRAIEH